MVAAQHMESQVALYLIVSLPPPRDGRLSSFFFPLCCSFASSYKSIVFLCSHLYFDLPGILTLHTSVSNLLLICCTFPCQPCMYGRSLVPVGRPGLDHKEGSR